MTTDETYTQGWLSGQWQRRNGYGIQAAALQRARNPPQIPDPGRLPDPRRRPYDWPRSRPAQD